MAVSRASASASAAKTAVPEEPEAAEEEAGAETEEACPTSLEPVARRTGATADGERMFGLLQGAFRAANPDKRRRYESGSQIDPRFGLSAILDCLRGGGLAGDVAEGLATQLQLGSAEEARAAFEGTRLEALKAAEEAEARQKVLPRDSDHALLGHILNL